MGRLANQPVASAAHWFLSRSALSKAFYVPTSLLNVPLTHAFELSSRIGQLALVLPEGIGLSIHTLRRDVHLIIGALGGSDEDVAGGADPLLAKDEGKRLDCWQPGKHRSEQRLRSRDGQDGSICDPPHIGGANLLPLIGPACRRTGNSGASGCAMTTRTPLNMDSTRRVIPPVLNAASLGSAARRSLPPGRSPACP